MEFKDYQAQDPDPVMKVAVDEAYSFYNNCFGRYVERHDLEIELALTTPLHHIFQILYMEEGESNTDYVLNVFVNKRTGEVDYCEESDDLSLDEDEFKSVYISWMADNKAGDLKGVLDL